MSTSSPAVPHPNGDQQIEQTPFTDPYALSGRVEIPVIAPTQFVGFEAAPYISYLPYTAQVISYYSQPDVEAAQRRVIAEQFAQVAANLAGVEEVWLDSTTPELAMTLIMRELDLDRELELRGIFITLTPSEPTAHLSVFATDDDVPDWAQQGDRLT